MELELWEEQIVDEITVSIRKHMAAGFLSPLEMATLAVEDLHEEPGMLRFFGLALGLTAEVLEQHLESQEEWPEVTDCDRLDLAFAELEQRGILARQNYECCSTCARSALRQEVKERGARGRTVRGFAYYHQQGTERAVAGNGLFLFFGSLEPIPEAMLAIGQDVVRTLQRHGLTTEWQGTPERCIVVPMEWQRRRFASSLV